MASIIKHGKKWRALIDRKGIRKSKVFPTRQEAKDWAAREELKIASGARAASGIPFSEVLDRYAREVSPKKRGHRWEVMQIERLMKGPLGSVKMKDLSQGDFVTWRDEREKSVAPGTIRRERTLINAILNMARKEWRLIFHNPLEGVSMPPEPRARNRLPTQDEFDRLKLAAGDDLNTATGRTFHAFRFACETAMRAGEIVGLAWDDIDLDTRVAHLSETKNGHPRDVPLSSAAIELLTELPELTPVFGLRSDQLDALFRKLKKRALIEGLRFHDSRAYALTMLSRKVDVMTLAKISGHRDLRILMNTYYRETAESIAKRLD